MKKTENKQAVKNVNEKDIRRQAIETLKKDVASYKSIKNVSIVVDYTHDSEKSSALLSEENTVSTRTSLDMWDLVHVYTTDTRKQLFYIRTTKTTFKFVVSPRIASQIKQEDFFKHSVHHADNLYFVAHKDGKKMFKTVWDAMLKASEKALNKEAEATVTKETTVTKEATAEAK